MSRDLVPVDIEQATKKGRAAPFYLFHGPNEFMMEKALEWLKTLIPESARAFNLEIFYGDESEPSEILMRAGSVPFLASRRLIIVRRVEGFTTEKMERFVPYLNHPAESTCLVFLSTKADFKRALFREIRSAGKAVYFENLKDSKVPHWISRLANELGLKMDLESCLYLQRVTGNDLKDLHGELEKVRNRFGAGSVTLEQVKETVTHHRSFTIFELVGLVSEKKCGESLVALARFLQEEDKKSGPLSLLGMLNRQIRLLFQIKTILEKGGKKREVEELLGNARFSANEFLALAAQWSYEELRRGLKMLYEADGQIKTGSSAKMVLENVMLRLCTQGVL